MAQEVKVSFYGGCFEAMGRTEAALRLPGPLTVEEFVEAVLEAHPALRRLRRLIVCARDEEYLEADDEIRPGDHILMMSALT